MFKNSLSTKILIMVEVILLISSSLFCTVSISRARSSIRKSIQQRMLDIANCAAASVNGDVLKLLSDDNVGGEESKEIGYAFEEYRINEGSDLPKEAVNAIIEAFIQDEEALKELGIAG